MSPEPLHEREFELINIVGAELASNQRDLSRHMDMSLGMTNMLVRRLISKGYIRIRQLNKRKVEYILTPKGFSEQLRKSVKYTMKTINSIGLIKGRVKEVILNLHKEGENNFFLFGNADLVFLAEVAFNELHLEGCRLSVIKEIPEAKIEGAILICDENNTYNSSNGNRAIDLLHELGKSDVLSNQW
jgi:DNA-binding MarR family transcriptional regulator